MTLIVKNTFIPKYPLVPTISVLPSYDPTFNTVNDDPNLRKQITEYIYNKISKNWLQYHYIDLYKYIYIENNQPFLIKKIEDKNTETSNNNIKYNFILRKFFKKTHVYDLLKSFIHHHNINWWDIKKNSSEFRHYLHKKIKHNIKQYIYKYNKLNDIITKET